MRAADRVTPDLLYSLYFTLDHELGQLARLLGHVTHVDDATADRIDDAICVLLEACVCQPGMAHFDAREWPTLAIVPTVEFDGQSAGRLTSLSQA